MKTIQRALQSVIRALPDGSLPVAVGLVLSGITTYAFLAIAARALGPEQYAPLSGLWSLLFLVAPAAFVPLEQETGRALAARRVLGLGGRSLLRRIAAIALVLWGTVVVLALAASPVLMDRIFDDEILLFGGLLFGVTTYAGSHIVKGATSGADQFKAYGGVLGAEGVIRVVLCIVLAVAGVDTPGPYGMIVGISPLVALAYYPRRLELVQDDGPQPAWWATIKAVGHLFLGAVFGALLLNAGPVAIKAISTPDQRVLVSRFLAGLVVARVPLFLFQAIQVALLPKLSALAATKQHNEFAIRVRRLLLVVLGLGLGTTTGAVTIGPPLILAVFGRGFEIPRGDLVLLGLAATAYMVALTFAQALIAHNEHHRATIGWFLGCAVFGIALVPETALLFRAERALLIGSLTAAASLAAMFLSVRAAAMHDVSEEEVALLP